MLAPLLFGTLYPVSKVVVGALFGLSLLLVTPQIGGQGSRRCLVPAPWGWLALLILFIPLLPVANDWMAFLNPHRWRLQQEFPIVPQPAWVPLTLSTSVSMQRLFDLALAGTAFWLARCAAPRQRFAGWMIGTLTVSLLLLAGSELWYQWSGKEKLLGLLIDRSGHAAGTFPNRNHFAGYIYVSSLFMVGWLLRQTWPLRFSRGLSKTVPSKFSLLLVAATTVFALLMAVRTGSRASLASFLVGIGVWLALLAARSPSRHRQLRIFGTALFSLFLIAASGDYVLNRLTHFGGDLSFKAALWQDAMQLCLKFPVFGTGPGAFAVAFNHFKSLAGDRTFLHAENEWLQLFIEHGLIGTAFLLIPVAFLIFAAVRLVRSEHPIEPELAFGAVAALVCSALHATVEFVFQIPANAILAASLAGLVVGWRDELVRPVVVPLAGWRRWSFHGAWTLALLAGVGAQGAASYFWYQGLRENSVAGLTSMRQTFRFWPWDSDRAIALTRQQVEAMPLTIRQEGGLSEKEVEALRAPLQAAIANDPFNWELRLERAWLNLTLAPELGVEQAKECVRLNPRQPKIPLQFAKHFAQRNRTLALQFLEMATLTRKEDFLEALEVGWNLQLEPMILWTLISDTPAGLEALADFAQRHDLADLAGQAQARLVLARRN